MTSSPSHSYVKPADKAKFKVYIAIDFGTDGLGLAYAINEEVYVHSRWNSKKYGDVVKPKTIILLDDKGDAVSFGMDAKFTYMNLATTQKNTWMLFERFKMSLYEDQICYSDQEEDDEFHDQENDNYNKENLKKNHKKLEVKSDEFDEKTLQQFNNSQTQTQRQRIRIKNELTAVNGKTYPAEKVFVAAFKYVKKEAKKYLRKKKIKNINDDEIGWVLTVPSIWNDESKNKMKQWAITAQLVNKSITNQCKIVYEPDCASIAIQMSAAGKAGKHEMKIGDKYILIDAGGGTIDIVGHEIIDVYPSFAVKETVPPSGGKWGSCYIDDQYIKLLENIFSANWVNEFKLSSPNIFVEIIHNFQQAKAKFFDSESEESKQESKQHNVRLPEDFICFIDEKIDAIDGMEDVEEFVNKSVLGLSKSICLDEEYLQIDCIVWKSMFDHSINPTIMHIKNKLLSNNKLKYKYLCLVGGLSTSKYFQFRMKNEFGPCSKYGLQLIIPRRPILCVVEGAAYFGIKCVGEYMKARRLRLSYGFVVNKPIDLAREMGISQEYICENKYFDSINNEYMVAGCFNVMARKNQQVLYDHVFIESSFRSDPNNMEVRSQVMCSDIEDPKTVQDGQELAEYTVLCKNKDDMEIIDEFHFYDTMLKVYSYSKNAPNIKTEVELSYN